MKLMLFSLFFLAGNIQNATPCHYKMTWSSASSRTWAWDQSSFAVAGGGTTTCRVSSSNCAYSYLELTYDDDVGGRNSHGSASGGGGSLHSNSNNCDATVTLSDSSDSSSLGIYFEWLSNDNVLIECSCNSPRNSGGSSGGGGSWSPPGVQDNGPGACFSADATVQVQYKGSIPMKNLQKEDRVLISGNKYQPVYSFGHHNNSKQQNFIQIHTDKATAPLEMTGNHLIYVMDSANGSTMKTVRADAIEVGDIVVGHHKPAAVTKLTMTQKKGVYMPLTPSGTIVVNGILASSYVSIQNEAPSVVDNSKFFPFISEDMISHWWMSPYRMMCLGISSNLCENEARDENGILHWLLLGKSFAEFADEQGFMVRVFVLGIPTFLLFALFNLLELVSVGPSLAPVLVLMAVAGALSWSLNMQNRRGSKKIV